MKPTPTPKIDLLRNKVENKKCFDCHEKGPTTIVSNLGVFVCSSCSGLHRELNHKVKGISVSVFNEQELDFIEQNGNENAQNLWMADWNKSLYPEPDKKDVTKMKEFFKMKY